MKLFPESWEKIAFRSYADLADLVRAASTSLPWFDEVVGIPRSGMVPATMLATARNVPLHDLNSFIYLNGSTKGTRTLQEHSATARSLRTPKKILLVDDSTNTGKAMRHAKAFTRHLRGRFVFISLAVFGVSGRAAKSSADFILERTPMPRIFEWNYLNHRIANFSAYDMDGVLCRDPLPFENDDGAQYMRFLRDAEPLFVPGKAISTIVTSRLEKYRGLTEEWLERHGVIYNNLIMLDGVSAEERRAKKMHAAFKAEVFGSRSEVVFFESNLKQAQDIHSKTGKKVISIEGNVMLGDFLVSTSKPRKIGQ